MSVETAKAGLPETKRCRFCQQPILWRTNDRTRRRAPIDAEPAPNGNIQLLEDDQYRVLSPKNPPSLFEAATQGPYHLNHFVTCEKRPKRTR